MTRKILITAFLCPEQNDKFWYCPSCGFSYVVGKSPTTDITDGTINWCCPECGQEVKIDVSESDAVEEEKVNSAPTTKLWLVMFSNKIDHERIRMATVAASDSDDAMDKAIFEWHELDGHSKTYERRFIATFEIADLKDGWTY